MIIILLFFTAIIYIMSGIILGGAFSLLFFRMDEGWKKIGTTLFGLGSSGGSYCILNEACGIEAKDMKIYLLAILLFSVTVSAIAIFCKLCSLLKNQDGENKIRILDIVLGQKNL